MTQKANPSCLSVEKEHKINGSLNFAGKLERLGEALTRRSQV